LFFCIYNTLNITIFSFTSKPHFFQNYLLHPPPWPISRTVIFSCKKRKPPLVGSFYHQYNNIPSSTLVSGLLDYTFLLLSENSSFLLFHSFKYHLSGILFLLFSTTTIQNQIIYLSTTFQFYLYYYLSWHHQSDINVIKFEE
jgi:hypothetical protein